MNRPALSLARAVGDHARDADRQLLLVVVVVGTRVGDAAGAWVDTRVVRVSTRAPVVR